MSFAKVAIVGNLGRDPETRYTPNGTLNVQFTIAASGRRRSNEGQGQDQENTTWFRVTAWDRLADRLVNLMERGYIGRGRLLYVEGQLESRQYTGNDGQVRTSLDVTMTDFQFVGSRQDKVDALGLFRLLGRKLTLPGALLVARDESGRRLGEVLEFRLLALEQDAGDGERPVNGQAYQG